MAPRSEFSHIQSPVSLVTYLFSQGSLVAGVPPPTQPCLVWTSAAVLMTPDPDHILWSGRSAALRRDALVSDIPTWQVAKTEGREPDCCSCTDTVWWSFNLLIPPFSARLTMCQGRRAPSWEVNARECEGALCCTGKELRWWKIRYDWGVEQCNNGKSQVVFQPI